MSKFFSYVGDCIEDGFSDGAFIIIAMLLVFVTGAITLIVMSPWAVLGTLLVFAGIVIFFTTCAFIAGVLNKVLG